MGCDWVRLFNKGLCDEILALNNSALADFVASHILQLDENSEFRFGFTEEVPIPDRIRRLRESGLAESELKRVLVDSLCVFGEWLYVDYWACYAEVFGDDPPGSVSDRELFPHLRSPHFLLLQADHVDRMIGSLSLHRAEVTVMGEKEISLLEQWRHRCTTHDSTMIAYFFDS